MNNLKQYLCKVVDLSVDYLPCTCASALFYFADTYDFKIELTLIATCKVVDLSVSYLPYICAAVLLILRIHTNLKSSEHFATKEARQYHLISVRL